MRALWAPFVTAATDDTAESLEIRTLADGWLVRLGNDEFNIWPDPWTVPEAARSLMVDRALHQNPGLIDIHAGVVVREDSALLLAGASGSGKTTLAIELLRKGWSYFSDDLAPYVANEGRVLAFPKPLEVSKQSWAGLRGLWQPPAWLPSPRSSFLVPATAFAAPSARTAVPRYLVFPTYEPGAAPSWNEVSPARAAAACCRFSRRVDPDRLGAVVRLCRRLRSFEISYPSSEEASALVEDIVAKVSV
jgi:hypothetical protein